MTNPERLPATEAVSEADLAEQRIPADESADDGLDPAALENADATEANPADLIDQAISVPLPDDDYDGDR
ncbi:MULTISPECIES: hypothetical protein [Mycolicibacter]|uniref:Uncharacterized protein n=1 Tax=Mycolicibacter virginiensis TaxID=1795032 RepID=A0A9X7INB0_9MYCO|nr:MULTISPECIES: hypothetical protein [Mycobacteriaceae]OBG31492.1 hypothetical protein A5671_09295 [Mycolicibacter heraklionensis]OBJ29832.1 hypothetical protein A5631_17110 [Mycolicibacter heraklionensis]PQM52183.1 hypothetical protein C5U48_10990 [Mycolicibacter virginiensis]ULP46568.1 hypothetical protein MJO54_17390 [Mycolicibacter virginiensis]